MFIIFHFVFYLTAAQAPRQQIPEMQKSRQPPPAQEEEEEDDEYAGEITIIQRSSIIL